eukprot:354370-Chlamydomonas_euryale.AAC.2
MEERLTAYVTLTGLWWKVRLFEGLSWPRQAQCLVRETTLRQALGLTHAKSRQAQCLVRETTLRQALGLTQARSRQAQCLVRETTFRQALG